MTTAAQALWDLLRPLGPYGSGGKFTLGELKSEGAALDGAEGGLTELEREAFLTRRRAGAWNGWRACSPAAR